MDSSHLNHRPISGFMPTAQTSCHWEKENGVYWTVYHVLLAMLFVTLCPCLLLSAFTLRISLALRAAVTKRHSMCAPSADVDSRNRKGLATKKEHKSNIMLVLVIAKFLVSDILPTVIDVLEHVVGQSAFMQSPLASLFVDLSNFLIVLNCSSNFWVFVFWGKRFRRSCRHVLLSCEIGESIYRLGKVTSDPKSSCTNLQEFGTRWISYLREIRLQIHFGRLQSNMGVREFITTRRSRRPKVLFDRKSNMTSLMHMTLGA
ncbi:hypothetical protein GCK32_014243 [Trichostrongylus colubriformis]|uniref:G-protein coupled receptors family 1 profile domain-containing protein n=1 Tax=Trichostrongylus colubriformis TaxID=6319 RepID=A0AAN8F647_TRICO